MRTVCYLIFGTVFLILGGIIYLLIQQNAAFASLILPVIKLRRVKIQNPILNYLLCNYGADMCWSASFTFFTQYLFKFEGKKVFNLVFCIALGGIWELLQLFNFVQGTADKFDLLAYLVGSAIAILLITYTLKKEGINYETKN